MLFLGGAYSQVPAIKYASRQGYYVITVDYLPDNPGHKLSDEYHNISTREVEKIVDLAKRLKIDAISAYASDPAAPTAAYVSEKMSLKGGGYSAVKVLSDKGLFRQFLIDNGFLSPWYVIGERLEDFGNPEERAVLKPADSSGSKGIAIVKNRRELEKHFTEAKNISRNGQVIVEQYIEKKGPQIHGEGFVLNRELVFLTLGDQYFSPVNPVAPFSTIVPSLAHQDVMSRAKAMVQEALTRVGFDTGGINVEIIRDKNDQLYILEIGARNGGNFMPQLMLYATGFDLIKANVDALFDKSLTYVTKQPAPGTYYVQLILHASREGYLKEINLPNQLRENIVEEVIYYEKGTKIDYYKNSRNVVGVMILKVSNEEERDIYFNLLKNNDLVTTVKV